MASPNKTITASNAIIMFSVIGVFDTPVMLEGFAADNIFSTDVIDPSEIQMGVDGHLSAGFVPREIKQTFSLNADSNAVAIFDAWYEAQQRVREIFRATANIRLFSVRMMWTCTKGVLSSYTPMPNAAKVLQPRQFGVTWESISPAPV